MRQSHQQTLDQQRAADAWRCVINCLDDAIAALETEIQNAKDQKRRDNLQKKLNALRSDKGGTDWRKGYGSLARKVPMLVLTNGLGQTLAFLRSKGKDDQSDEHNVLFRHLSAWTLGQVASNAGNQTLLDWVVNNDSTAYRRATTEALASLTWLKRFAEAELPTEEG
jgi:CRISPR-associated protein Cmr5